MEIALYILAGVFALFGLGVWLAAAKSKSTGHILGGLCYVGGAIGAVTLKSWWPLVGGVGLAFVVRYFFGDSHRASSAISRSNEYKDICLMFEETEDPFSFAAMEKRRIAENRLFVLIESDRELNQILKSKNTDIDRLKKIYETLIEAGAGQWAGTEFVPTASITTPYTLTYLLDELEGEELPSENPNKKIEKTAWNVLNFFLTGEPLP